VGPFFSIGLTRLNREHLAAPGVSGERVSIEGRVLDGDGKPVPDAILEIWQANAHGKYAHPDDPQDKPLEPEFSGFGRIPTDANGGFRFTTIKPGQVPGPQGKLQAPHLVVSVFSRGLLRRLVTRIYFPDEPANANDFALGLVPRERRATLVARKISQGEGALAWDVHLQGSEETVFSDRARIQSMLEFEAALARAEASVGVIPASAAAPIAAKCRAELFDFESLAQAAAHAGNLAIPLVKQLTALVAAEDKEGARFVHWGATSQDAIDTGFLLQARRALELTAGDLDRFSEILAQLAQKHSVTTLAGRTWMQQALPTTLGLRVAGWLEAVDRHRVRLDETRSRALVLQFGGAVGTLAALGDKGMEVAKALGEELKLVVPAVPWHAHRDRMAEIATTLGLCAGTLGKIARDLSLQGQTEVAEVFEPAAPGRGGSSTMPHKRNPVTAAAVLAAATRVPALVGTMLSAMVQEQERGLGGWHAEWETLPEIISLTAGALHQLAETVEHLDVDTNRMRANLEVTQGLIFAEAVQMVLAEQMGRLPAHELVEAACKRALKQKQHLRDVLAEEPKIKQHLDKKELERLFDPAGYLGVASELIDRVLEAHSSLRTSSSKKASS
jgi:3-carboxy-cis,cis-muconate cycloisomerase